MRDIGIKSRESMRGKQEASGKCAVYIIQEAKGRCARHTEIQTCVCFRLTIKKIKKGKGAPQQISYSNSNNIHLDIDVIANVDT